MSTKTLRKRIALVAVSAMGFGLLTSVSANAATAVTAGSMFVSSKASVTGAGISSTDEETARSVGWVTKTGTGTTATNGGLKVTVSSVDYGYELKSGGTGTAVVAAGAQIAVTIAGAASSNASIVVTGGKLSGVSATTTSLGTGGGVASDRTSVVNATQSATEYTWGVATVDSGAATMTIAAYTGANVSTTSPSNGTLIGVWTLTVASASASGVYAPTYSYVTQQPAVAVSAAINGTSNTYDTTTSAPNGYFNVVWVYLADAYGAAVTTGTLAASATNGSLVKFGSSAGVNYTATASFDTTTPAAAGVWLSIKQPVANTAGSTTVTFTHNGQTVGSKTVNFTGDLAKIDAGMYSSGTSGSTGKLYYKFYDAAGNRIADANSGAAGGIGSLALVATNDGNTNTIAVASGTLEDGTTGNRYTTSTWTGRYTFNCASTQVSKEMKIQVKATNSALATVTSPAFTVRCADANIATYTVALDKPEYKTGDVATLTITAKDLRGVVAPASAATLGDGASIALGGMTAVTAPSTVDTSYNDDGVWTYKYTVGTSTGNFVASVQLPSSLVDDQAKTIQYKVVASSTSVTNEEVLAAIVKLIASINKQIAALQKALTKKK